MPNVMFGAVPCRFFGDNLQDTQRMHADLLVHDVAAAFLAAPAALMEDFQRALNISDMDRLEAIVPDYHIPETPQRTRLIEAFRALYAKYSQDRKRLDKARGVVLEHVVYSRAMGRYEPSVAYCEHNVCVGLWPGNGTERTIDVAAWQLDPPRAEFYECKIKLELVQADDPEPINTAHNDFEAYIVPNSAHAVICTLVKPSYIARLLREHPVLQSFGLRFPDIEILYLLDVLKIT